MKEKLKISIDEDTIKSLHIQSKESLENYLEKIKPKADEKSQEVIDKFLKENK